MNKVHEAYYTMDPIKADDGSHLKVALFDENNMKITFGSLSSASVEVASTLMVRITGLQRSSVTA